MDRYGPSRPPKSMRPAPYGAFVLFTQHQAQLSQSQISIHELSKHAAELATAIECLLISPVDEMAQPIAFAKAAAQSFRALEARSAPEVK